ncbi:RraA family protein [Pseudoroseicyclus sp. CXY001]|uniref:RraA family protein n=1 Tax=Pseudoroseicyclus sp. CXY001 TaxID=3242492 RepID=UPI00358DA497
MEKKLTGKIAKERIRLMSTPRPPAHIIEGLKRTGPDSSLVSDVMDILGITGVIPASVMAPTLTGRPIVGPAVTVRNVPLDGTSTANDRAAAGHNSMAEMEAHNLSGDGDVIVIEGVLGLSNMGGVSSQIAQRQGIVGAIVEGGVRDLNHSRALGFPLWATEISPVTGKWRIETVEINGPIQVCGLWIRPGDIIVADDTGVCVLPIERAEEIMKLCVSKYDLEQKRLAAVADGAHIADLPTA